MIAFSMTGVSVHSLSGPLGEHVAGAWHSVQLSSLAGAWHSVQLSSLAVPHGALPLSFYSTTRSAHKVGADQLS